MNTSTSINTPLGSVEFTATGSAKLELRSCNLPPNLPNGMEVEKVIAVILDVVPENNIFELVFDGQLKNQAIKGGYDSGESLDCVTWETDEWALSLGTEDHQAINERLPNLQVPEMPNPVTYSSSGLRLSLAELTSVDNPISFHFILAYKQLPDDRECSTWFAVDVQHEVAKLELV